MTIVDAKSLFQPIDSVNATLEFEFKVQESNLDPTRLKQLQINEFAASGTFSQNPLEVEVMYYDMKEIQQKNQMQGSTDW